MSGTRVPSWRAHADRFTTPTAPAALSEALPAHVRAALDALRGAGHEAVAVGGGVRDALLGRPVTGYWDLASSAAPDELTRLFPGAVPTGIAHGTVTLPDTRGPIEI